MARPKKTAQELINSGARAGRIAARRIEESDAVEAARPTPGPDLVSDFSAALDKEQATFSARIVPGQTVAMEYGVRFNWRTNHPLTIVRKFAEQVAKELPTAHGPVTHRLCKNFLASLEHGHERGFVIDPCAAENLPLWLALKNWECETLAPVQLLCPVQIISWKTKTGEYRLNDLWWDCAGEFESAIRAGMKLLSIAK